MAFSGLVKRKLSFENNVHLWANRLHVLKNRAWQRRIKLIKLTVKEKLPIIQIALILKVFFEFFINAFIVGVIVNTEAKFYQPVVHVT